jgi:hypothetical protein
MGWRGLAEAIELVKASVADAANRPGERGRNRAGRRATPALPRATHRKLLITLENFYNGDADLVAMDNDVAGCHRLIVGQNQHRVILTRLQFDHRAAAHAQQLVHGNHRFSQNDRDFDFDVG